MTTTRKRKGNSGFFSSAKSRMCDGKRGYDSMAEAGEVADRMQAEYPENTYSVYPCLFCRFVHVGRRAPIDRVPLVILDDTRTATVWPERTAL